MEVEQAMSKDLAESAVKLERRADRQVMAIRQAVREYNEAFENAADSNTIEQLEKQREIERRVAEHIQLYKALRRLRKKMRAAK